jgi:tryptophan synthase alpha chain
VDIASNVMALRQVTPTPICVGFGISTAAQVREVTRVADGAIVGSAVIRRIADAGADIGQQCAALQGLMHELGAGLGA